MTRVLLSGFEPFGDFACNPSWDALKLSSDEGILPADTHITRLPVDYASTFDTFSTAVEAIKPQAVASFGLHGGMKDRRPATIYIETVARNRDGAGKPDNAGRLATGAIVTDGDDQLNATFPADAMLLELRSAGFDVELSDNAGAYLCNHLFYRALHAYGDRFPYGFVHVPPVDSMGGVLSTRRLAQAVAIIAGILGTSPGVTQ